MKEEEEVNKVVLIGRCVRDWELRYTQKGTSVASNTLAVDKKIKNPETGKYEADFIPVVIWGKPAETLANYSGKGKLVGLFGRIETRNYIDKDGIKRYVTEVIGEEVKILEWPSKGNNSNEVVSEDDNGFYPVDEDDEEIPF